MNIHFGNQSQFELFPKTTGDTIENVAPRFIFSRIILSFENLVVVFVFIIVSLIVAFSVGVERGRHNTAMARTVAQAVSPAAVVPNSLAHPQISVMPGPSASGRSAYPAGKSASVMAGTAEAARVFPAPAPVLPAMDKTAPSEKIVDKGYTIQVASYKKESYAQKEAADLKKQGLDSLVIPKGNYSIICVGRFANQEQARGMLNKLKKRYKDCMIRSL